MNSIQSRAEEDFENSINILSVIQWVILKTVKDSPYTQIQTNVNVSHFNMNSIQSRTKKDFEDGINTLQTNMKSI